MAINRDEAYSDISQKNGIPNIYFLLMITFAEPFGRIKKIFRWILFLLYLSCRLVCGLESGLTGLYLLTCLVCEEMEVVVGGWALPYTVLLGGPRPK